MLTQVLKNSRKVEKLLYLGLSSSRVKYGILKTFIKVEQKLTKVEKSKGLHPHKS